MRMTKLKDVSQLGVFKDIIDLQIVDGSVEAVVIKFNGQELRITSSETYSKTVQLTMPEPKQEVKKYRVSGSYMGNEIVPKIYEDEYDAKAFIIEMNGKLPYGEEHSLAIEEFVEYTESTRI